MALLFFTNDRVLPKGRVLKCLLTDNATGTRSLNATFRLVDGKGAVDGVQFRVPAGFRRREDIPGNPFSFGELPTTGLKPGAYSVETLIQSNLIANRECLIIDAAEYRKATSSVNEQKLVRQTEPKSTQEVRDTWERAWNRWFNYLGSELRYSRGGPVSLFDIGFDIEVKGRSQWKEMCREAADWAHFHVLRFAFNQVFYGGHLKVRQVDNPDALVFQIAVSSKTPLASRLPPDLAAVLDSLKSDGYSVQVRWQRDQDAYEATLDVAWRQGRPL